jgi:2,4-dienoyl-CoA reductase-like NADH-dependent reductase (Old Yellow Enzyme family)/thioredoxin reductase
MAATTGWQRLFQPGYIGIIALNNRMVMPPIGTNFASEDGQVTEQLLNYYEARARGGPGLVIVEVACIEAPVGIGIGHELVIDDDRFLSGLSKLAEVIKKHGARAAIQLHHAGMDAKPAMTGQQAVGPSAVSIPTPGREVAHELSVSEIANLVELFARAAVRAQRAGFEAVEVHGAHPYLVAQFNSAAWNKRQDAYGGELRNRARFLLEIIKAIKEAAGADFPVWPRINAIEYELEGGLSLEEGKQLARMVEDAGADAVHVSCYGWGASAMASIPESAGTLLPLAREVKKGLSLPVIAVGRITPELAEQALGEGWADFIGTARALLADPDYITKLAEGRPEEVNPCIACSHCIHAISFWDQPLTCTVNPALGREREYAITRATKPKRVLVVGGGPAGMEAARVAALRGHQVTLCEKDSRLGGQLNLALVPPNKRERIEPLAKYLSAQLEKLNVDVRLGTEATPELLEQLKPDAVVLACGVNNRVPEIPGIDRPNVVSYEDVLEDKVTVGDKVAVIGGELVGCETAEFLAEQGKQVTIMRRGQRIATKVLPAVRFPLLSRLRSNGITMLTQVNYQEIDDRGIVLTTKEGELKSIEADTVVLAAGADPNNKLYQALEGKAKELYLIGDAAEPRSILEAVADGARVGRTL